MSVRMVCASLAALAAAISTSVGAKAPAAPGADAARANPAAWPAAASPAALTDPAIEAAIDKLLQRMTLEQKVGQIIQGDISAITPADLARYPIGSILAGGNSGPGGNERASASTWMEMVNTYREASRKSGAGIPILFGVDAVHGHSNLPGATIFPHNIGLGAANDPELMGRIGQVTAAEVAGSGIEWTFAPTLAVPQDLRWGRSYEGYGADPALVASYGRALTLGLQGPLVAGRPLGSSQVAASAKHFLADGGTVEGRDQGDARISEAELIARHAAGYPAAIDAGALTVMASFSSWNGVKHHGNASLLTDVLKGRMGFNGLVVGDWNGHGQVAGCSVTSCPAAINAGLDLFMAPDSWKGLFDSTVQDVRAGRISAQRLDDAVRRNLRVKHKLGLMGPLPVERGDPAMVGADAHLAVAREAVAKSLVLLKNNDQLLPIRPGARVLVAGPGADSMAMQAGGWTITWQGTDTTAADFPKGNTIGRAIVKAVTEAGGTATLSPEGKVQAIPDVAIIVLGENPYAEFQGDIPHLAFEPRPQDAALIDGLRAQGTRVVLLFLSGRPLFVPQLLNRADAFVAAWLPGSQGEGVADVLVAGRSGRTARDFTGRLSFPWPADARSPLVEPLFPAGYGLSYTSTAKLGPVSEDPKVDLKAFEARTTFFRRGVAPAPWYLAADGTVTSRAVDLSAQEDARQFRWVGPGKISIEGPAIDLAAQAKAGAALVLDWRIDGRGRGPVGLTLGGAKLDIAPMLASAPTGAVTETRIPLSCFAAAGADLAAVGAPIRLDADKGFAASLRTARVADGTSVPVACPPTTR
jgi:beta-glucosidase